MINLTDLNNQLIVPGPQGIQGEMGPAGAGITPRGAWDNATNYSQFDVIEYLGSAWSANATNTNKIPGTDPEWDLLIAKGDPGNDGADGLDGASGEIWIDVSQKTADYTANDTERIPVNTSGGVVNITVPASGNRFWVYDSAATDSVTGFSANSCFILPQSEQTVRGGSSFELDVAGLGLGFKLIGTNWVNYNG